MFGAPRGEGVTKVGDPRTLGNYSTDDVVTGGGVGVVRSAPELEDGPLTPLGESLDKVFEGGRDLD